jgi:hypothetical protein
MSQLASSKSASVRWVAGASMGESPRCLVYVVEDTTVKGVPSSGRSGGTPAGALLLLRDMSDLLQVAYK